MSSYVNKRWSNSDFHNSDFRRNSFVNCTFSNCTLTSCDFAQASFMNCKFTNTDLLDSNFSQASLMNCKFSNCELSRTRFSGATLTNTRFSNTPVDEAIDLNLDHLEVAGASESSVVSFGSQVIQQSSSVSGFSSGSHVRLVSGGISEIDLQSWVRVHNEGHAYRIEVPGANIRVSGTYTFVNRDKFLHTEASMGHVLSVSVGKVVRDEYQTITTWDLETTQWCEVSQTHFAP